MRVNDYEGSQQAGFLLAPILDLLQSRILAFHSSWTFDYASSSSFPRALCFQAHVTQGKLVKCKIRSHRVFKQRFLTDSTPPPEPLIPATQPSVRSSPGHFLDTPPSYFDMASSSNFFSVLDADDASLSSSPSPATTPRQEVSKFTREPSPEFGSRLANARNLRPDEAPPAPPPRPRALVAEGSAAASSHLAAVSWTPLPGEKSFKPIPKYGGIKGSYTSPFDSGGKTPGDIHLASSSTTIEEFEAKYGSGASPARAAAAAGSVVFKGNVGYNRNSGAAQATQTISFGHMPPVTLEGNGKRRADAEIKPAPTVPNDVSFPGLIKVAISITH